LCRVWIQQAVTQQGVDCIIVNPADVSQTDKESVNKMIAFDTRANALRSGVIKGIYVPQAQKLEDRTLVRMRQLFVKKQTRSKNQIVKGQSDYPVNYWRELLRIAK
ncbi:hypothetical protein JNL27_17155, partial [bacterium]|nr:hypothetical protein [bacterium]